MFEKNFEKGIEKLPKELEKVIEWAEKALDSDEVRTYLFNHTQSEFHYEVELKRLEAIKTMKKALGTWK